MNKVNILGVKVDRIGINDAADKIFGFLSGNECAKIYTPNSEIIMMGYNDKNFAKILNEANILTADGIGVVKAAQILKNPVPERAAGFDIACRLLDKLSKSDYKLFLFGGKPGIAELAAEKLTDKYPGLKICGTRNGYFRPEETPEIIEEINNSGADVVFVCLGAPKQEQWIHENADKLKTKAALGVGGSLDVFAGTVERAPEFYCKHGLEWFYRLVKEPWRAKRMTALPKFAITVILHGKKFKQGE